MKTKAPYKRTVLCWDLMSSKEKEWRRHFIPIMRLGNSPYNSPYPNSQRHQARHLILKCKLIVKISGQLRDISILKETKTANPEETSSFCRLPSKTSEKVALLGPSLGFLKFTIHANLLLNFYFLVMHFYFQKIFMLWFFLVDSIMNLMATSSKISKTGAISILFNRRGNWGM